MDTYRVSLVLYLPTTLAAKAINSLIKYTAM